MTTKYSDSPLYIREHPTSQTSDTDSHRINPGETLGWYGAHWADEKPMLYLYKDDKYVRQLGRLSSNLTWQADEPGHYEVYASPNVDPSKRPADRSHERISDYHVKPASDPGDVTGVEDTTFSPGDVTNVDETPSPSDIATNNPGIVPADNDEGIALAPSLRREGASLGPEGGTVTLPDGDTVEVGAIEESDEVARYLDGEQAGDVVDADQGAVSDPSGSGGGLLGGAAAVVVLLVAGGAALLGGDS